MLDWLGGLQKLFLASYLQSMEKNDAIKNKNVYFFLQFRGFRLVLPVFHLYFFSSYTFCFTQTQPCSRVKLSINSFEQQNLLQKTKSKMAAVIASVSLHQETKNVLKLKKQVGIHKSNYSIPSFDRRFHPLHHNIFFKRFVFYNTVINYGDKLTTRQKVVYPQSF